MNCDWAPRYVVITPVKNEADYLHENLQSMVQQTIKPCEWLIVNDGSTDGTQEIAAGYAAAYPWIKLVNRGDRGFRQRGKGVVEAFYTGYASLSEQNYDFIVKLDGDVSFGPTYFESLLREFAARPRLGIAGGGVYEQVGGEWALCTVTDHVRGATKVYRWACFEAIGGLMPTMGWDGIDEWKALALNWEVRSFTELKVLHHRCTGMATGKLKSRIEEAHAAYYMAYHPLYMIARGIHHLASRPYVIGGIAMIVTCFADWLRGRERLTDPSLVQYIRRTQMGRLAGLLAGRAIYEH